MDSVKKLLLLAATVLCSSLPSRAAEIEVQQSDHSISMRLDGRVVWTFHHDPAEGKPYFHPMATTDGRVFTDLRPEDHPWHRGVWFSWKFVNGINYWEENRKSGESKGKTRLLSIERHVTPDQQVQVHLKLVYAPGVDGKSVLREDRKLTIHPPDASGDYRIDWRSEFRSQEKEVVLDRTPIPGEPKGKGYGGYAGYSIRMNKAAIGGIFENSEEQTGEEARFQPARWMSYSLPTGGGLLFMDHPGNLRHPPRWYVAPGMPYFSPALIYDAPYTIRAGQTLELRYRIIIAREKIPAPSARRQWREWIEKE